jgi:predicted Zn-dependent protease
MRLIVVVGVAGSPVEEVLTIPGVTIEGYFRSHPPTAERIARINDVVRQDRLDASRHTRPLETSAQREVQQGVISRDKSSPPSR